MRLRECLFELVYVVESFQLIKSSVVNQVEVTDIQTTKSRRLVGENSPADLAATEATGSEIGHPGRTLTVDQTTRPSGAALSVEVGKVVLDPVWDVVVVVVIV